MPAANNPITPVNPMKLGLYMPSAPECVEVAEGEDVVVPVPLAAEALEETWLGYNDPRGLISNA
jgi:hypothetical protein